MTRFSLLELLVLPTLMMDPGTKFRVASVVSRNNSISVLFLELAEFPEPFSPGRLVSVKTKIQCFEFLGTFLGHMGSLALFQKSVVTALLLDPKTQFWELGVIERNVTMTILLSKLLQVRHVLRPGCCLGVPGKIKLFKKGYAFGSNARLLSVLQEFVLFAVNS